MRISKTVLMRIITGIAAVMIYAICLFMGCSGNGGDPTGVIPDMNSIIGTTGQATSSYVHGSDPDRAVWGGWVLDIRPEEGVAEIVPLDRGLEAHFNVTGMVTPPECKDCVQLKNFSFDKSAGIIDLDALLINPTQLGGYDVRAVLLLKEWDTGRRLVNEDGLTDFWSGDPYHPDPFIIFAKEANERYFGPLSQYTAHVTLSLPTPYNFKVPFIVDASYPDHSKEPVEIRNVNINGSIHLSGYNLTITAELLDWQKNAKGLYLDCSRLNPLAGLMSFTPNAGSASGENYSSWTLHLQSDATNPDCWFPQELGKFELPLIALDSEVFVRTFKRIEVEVTKDTEPPQWTGDVGVDEIWWGNQRAIVSFYPATDASGPVRYNIYMTSDISLVPPSKQTVTGWRHYSVETVDGAEYTFIIRAQDQAGNEDNNDFKISGKTRGITKLWEREFSADLESPPNVRDVTMDQIPDVVFGCDNGKVYCLNGQTGAVQWGYQTQGMVKGCPAIRDLDGDNMIEVTVGSNDSSVYVINTIFGEPFAMLKYATGNIVESSPVCADQTGDGIAEVVVGSFDKKLYAFKGGTGELLVEYNTGAPVRATPALGDFNGDGRLDVVVASGGVVRAINGITGVSLWNKDFGTGFSEGSPAIGDFNGDKVGDVVAGTTNAVYVFDVGTSKTIWSNTTLSGNFDTSPALGDVTGDGVPDVAISSKYVGVYLLDGKNGSVVWVSKDNIYVPTDPILSDMNADGIIDVIVGSADYALRIINGVNGFTLGKFSTSPYGAVTTTPIIADLNGDAKIDIVFGTANHRVFAISTNWQFPTDLNLMPWPKFMRSRSNTGNLALPLY